MGSFFIFVGSVNIYIQKKQSVLLQACSLHSVFCLSLEFYGVCHCILEVLSLKRMVISWE